MRNKVIFLTAENKSFIVRNLLGSSRGISQFPRAEKKVFCFATEDRKSRPGQGYQTLEYVP